MVGNKFSDTSVESIGSLLNNNIEFRVPKFQRNYSWDQETVEQLWTDLMDTFGAVRSVKGSIKEAQYLLGPIVLVPEEGKPSVIDKLSVIDGQQRLATLTLLFCVIRDVIMEDAEAAGAPATVAPVVDDLLKSMIENTDIDGQHESWKLALNDTDKVLFREIQQYEHNQQATQIERLQKMNPKTKSAKRLKSNYIFLHERIRWSLASGFGDNIQEYEEADRAEDREIKLRMLRIGNVQALKPFIRCVRTYNFLVKIVVPDDGTAFQVFETLNQRGQTLAKSNLIKNYVLSKVGKNNEDMQNELSNRWNAVFDDKIGRAQRDDEFILESFRSRHFDKTASIKNLYRLIKKMIPDEDPPKCERYVKELECDAEFAAEINDPSSGDPNTRIEIDALKALGAKLVRIPILAAHRRWGTDDNYKTVVVTLVKFFFKFRVVRRKHPGDVAEAMIEVARMIENGETPDRILDKIKTYDDHEHFLAEFKNEFVKAPSKSVAKYVLQQITLHLDAQYDDVKPVDGLTLEHILPQEHQKWNKNEFFKGYSGVETDKSKFVMRLGNLTLLSSAINSKMKNQEFYHKNNYVEKSIRAGYKSSKLAINKETVCDKDEWTANVIMEREELFATYADKIWRL